jgi:hypothetical protein
MKSRRATAGQNSTAEVLAALLAGYPPDLLRKLETRAGVKRSGSKVPSPPNLARALLDAKRVAAELAACPPDDREFLAFVAGSGGRQTVTAADWWLRHRGIDDPALVMGALAEKGLLFIAEAGREAVAGKASVQESEHRPGLPAPVVAGALWVPDVVGEHIRDLAPPQLLPKQAEPFVVERAALSDVIRELFVLARFLSARSARVLTTTRHMAREDFVALAADLGRAEQAERARRLEEVPDLLWLEAAGIEAGLIEVQGGRVVATAEVESFFGASMAEQCRAIVEAVVGQARWGELETAPDIIVERSRATPQGRSDVPSPGRRVRARRAVLEALTGTTTPGQWHSMEDLAKCVMDRRPEFLIRRRPTRSSGRPGGPAPEPTYRGLSSGDRRHSEPIGMLTGWRDVEGVFVSRFVGISLRRAGVVDVGSGESGECFRLTDLGARVLGMTDDAPEAGEDQRAPGRFFLQPNFEIIADGGGDNVGAIWRLSHVAELVSFDRAALLKVTRESICSALDHGMSGGQIMETLSGEGQVEVPQNVAFSVGEWIDAYQRYEVRVGAWIVETDTADELDELEEALPGCLERIGPTAARVRPDRRREVEKALPDREGVVEIDHSRGVEAAFHLDDRMDITPDPESWHWYVHHVLGKIAEPSKGRAGALRFRLTRDSVQEALASGLAAEEIRSFVVSGADRPLSAAQEFALQGWLGLYEPVELASVTLLKVAPQAVSGFLAVPEVRQALVGGLGLGVFVVESREARKLARVLEEAGVTVEREVQATPLKQDAAPAPGRPEARGAARPRWGRRRWKAGEPEADRTALLEAAIAGGRQVLVDYRSVVRGEANRELVLSPRSLEASRWGQQRLHAYCHWRQAYRTFDLSRMDEVVALDDPAYLPPSDEAEPPE